MYPVPFSSLDEAGQQVSETSALQGVVNSSYNGSNELTSSGANSYSWDAEGNPTGSGYTVNADNELLTTPTDNFSYDKEGQLIEDTTTATGDTWFYGYNNAGQMVSAQEYTASSGGTLEQSITYEYDVFGNRVEESLTRGGITTGTVFAYNGWNPAKAGAMGNSGYDIWGEFSQGAYGFELVTTRFLDGDAVGQMFGRIDSVQGVGWFLTDAQGSVRDVTNYNSSIWDNIQYDAFGNITAQSQYNGTGNPIPETPASDQTLGLYAYAGMVRDAATGLYHDNARDYNSILGRFTSQDPMGFDAGDSNLYRYVNDAPTAGTDPSGLQEAASAPNQNSTKAIPNPGNLPYAAVYNSATGKWERSPSDLPAFDFPYSYLGDSTAPIRKLEWWMFKPVSTAPNYDASIFYKANVQYTALLETNINDHWLLLPVAPTRYLKVLEATSRASPGDSAEFFNRVDRNLTQRVIGKETNDLLQHERVHLLIGDEIARSATAFLKQQVAENDGKYAKLFTAFDPIDRFRDERGGVSTSFTTAKEWAKTVLRTNMADLLTQVTKAEDAANFLYDSIDEANHGNNPFQQDRWNKEYKEIISRFEKWH